MDLYLRRVREQQVRRVQLLRAAIRRVQLLRVAIHREAPLPEWPQDPRARARALQPAPQN
jgi:hypothetical protein